jgi:hypothetical protein
VKELARLSPRWDDMIAADLFREVQINIAVSGHDMRLALAIRGYREMHDILIAEAKGRPGIVALRAMALALRRYAKERPCLSAAIFRSPMIESSEWMEAASAVRQLFIKAFQKYGLDEVAAGHALRMLRSLVHGYVIGEMSGGVLSARGQRRVIRSRSGRVSERFACLDDMQPRVPLPYRSSFRSELSRGGSLLDLKWQIVSRTI